MMKTTIRCPGGRTATKGLLASTGTALAAVCSMAALLAGCDDGLICQTEVLVAIVEPSGIVTEDLSAAVDGVQTDVRVRTTFGRGATLTLTVEDDGGNVLTTLTAESDAQGNAIFEDVTIPGGGGDLRVVGDAGECGRDEDVRHVELAGGGDCTLEFATAPEANAFYAPLDVFNSDSDTNAALPGHQGDVVVLTQPGHDVRVYLSGPGAVETQVGAGTAGDTGELRLAMSLPEGQDNLRAECVSPTGQRSSPVISVFVDTVAPACTLTSPLPGTSITPSLDDDANLANGIQLELAGRAAGGDTAGEGTRFVITAPGGGVTTLVGTVDGAGASTADASFNPATPPADFGVEFATIDHAGNPCSAATTYRVVYNGCPIVVTAPTTTVSVDADGNAANGAQIDVVLDVDDACIGRTVTSDCGSNDVGGVVGAGGALTLRANVCSGLPCESTELCTVRVTSTDGIETTAGASLVFDNQPPSVSLQIAQPAGVTCGGTVTPAQDIDGALTGTQIRMRVVSPTAADRRLQLTNSAGTNTFDANIVGGEVVVTVLAGANDFIGRATDAANNTASTPVCRITLADISVNFTGSPADGTVGAVDGSVTGGSLTFTLTGTVSAAGATVNISVDGGPPTPAVVVGTSWSLVMTLAGRVAPYAILASAASGPQVGSANLNLVVDLLSPPAVGSLVGTAITRRTIRLSFTAPNDGGAPAASYRIKYATVALTDGNFDSTGVVASAPTPGAPGSPQTVNVTTLRAGTAYWVGVAALDASGNRSVAQIAGPITPAFDATGVIPAPNVTGAAGFGAVQVRGHFNDDAFEDVAVSAPYVTSAGLGGAGEVYIFLGSATGLATTPATTIRGTAAGGQLGNGLATVRWSSATRDDLAISAPFAGAIYVFNGGAAFPAGAVNDVTAPRRFNANPSANWFTGSGFGWAMAGADHDGDGTDDLVASMVFGGGGTAGAAVVFYGGTVPTGTVSISDLSASGSGTAVMRMYEVIDPNFPGLFLHNLGRTQGASDLTDDVALGFGEEGTPNHEILVFRGAGRPPSAGVTREPFTIGRDVRLRLVTNDLQSEWGAAMTSIDDQNGDGARDLVIGDWREGNDQGRVHIIDGDTLGTGGVALNTTPGIVIAEMQFNDTSGVFGVAIGNNASSSDPDIDGDGREDLVVAGRIPSTTQAALFVWFGPIPPGVQNPPAPNLVITGPASFSAQPPASGGPSVSALWADVNNDGLDDICWGDWTSNSSDGGIQVLWDDGN